jgi:hypothetical protein
LNISNRVVQGRIKRYICCIFLFCCQTSCCRMGRKI